MKRALFLTLLALAMTSGGRAEPSQKWVELHPDADWNKFSSEEIQEFTGCLELEPNPETISFVMRFNPYKLATQGSKERLDVYGRAPELETFVGRQVVIRGKRVQSEVEGVLFDEIWPTAIRATE